MGERLKKALGLSLSLALIVTITTSGNRTQKVGAKGESKAKNVIMMIPDGMSVEESTVARWCKGGKALTLDQMAVGQVKTYWNDGPITDSAPSGSAYATGHKSDDGHVATAPKKEKDRPLATVLEAAKLKGKATGIVTTCEVMHATPADFTAHDANRSNYTSLMTQQVFNGIDVVLGGGDKYFRETKAYNGKTLKEQLISLGYDYFTNRDEMVKSNSNKIWGMFADIDLKYDLDRVASADIREPSLEDMTKKAIDTLSKNKDGFFLMVEGSKIDWAAHANDTAGVVGDIMSFDKAVKAALDFAKEDGNTVVVVAADHGTGGMTIGSNVVSKYSSAKFEETTDKLRNIKATVDYLEKITWDDKLNSRINDDNKIKEAMTLYGVTDLSDKEKEDIKKAPKGKLGVVISPMLSKRVNIGWIYTGHVGGDVALYNYAPEGVETLEGVVDNTDVGKYIIRVLGVNVEELSNKLFVNAKEAFEKLGVSLEISVPQKDTPILTVKKGDKKLILNGFTNIANYNGVDYKLDGVIVCNSIYDKNNKINVYDVSNIYVPQQAIDMFK